MTTVYEHKTQLVGDDYTGLPTRPVQYRGKSKASSINWDQIAEEYVAAGGQVDASVWPNHGKVVVIGSNSARSSRANIHSFTEADAYDEPKPAQERAARKPAARKPGYRPPSKLTDEQRATIGRRYRDGESLSELAKDYGVALNTISNTLKAVGVARRTRLEAGVIRREKSKS